MKRPSVVRRGVIFLPGRRVVHSGLFVALLALVFLLPFPLGSNRIWAWSFEALITTVLVMGWVLVCDTHCMQAQRRKIKVAAPLWWLSGAWLLWHVLFVVPMPADWVETLAPAVAAQSASGAVRAVGLSLDRHASVLFLLQSMFYALFFFIVYILVDSSRRVWALWWIVFMAAVVQAVYGLWLVSTGSRGLIYGFYDVSAVSLAGSFVNRNHAVAFLTLGLLSGLALRARMTGRLRDRARSRRLAPPSRGVQAVRFVTSPVRILDVLLVLVGAAMAATHSRAGLFSAVVAVMVFALLAAPVRAVKNSNRHDWVKKVLLLTGVLSVTLLVSGADWLKTGQRLQTTQGQPLAGERWLALQQGWRHAGDYWPWGTGGGTYQNFFVLHRHAEQTHYFDHAHNDYLEFLVESGVGSLIIAAAVLWIFCVSRRAYRRSPRQRPAVAMIFAVGAYFLLHGLVDFNARIPANVLTAMALVAGSLGWLGSRQKLAGCARERNVRK